MIRHEPSLNQAIVHMMKRRRWNHWQRKKIQIKKELEVLMTLCLDHGQLHPNLTKEAKKMNRLILEILQVLLLKRTINFPHM